MEIIIKLIACLICTSGLIYQSIDLLFQFMTGKTVVNMEVGHIFDDTLPAITICYPFVLSMDNAVNGSREEKSWRSEYLDIESVIASFDNNSRVEENHKRMEQIYYTFAKEYFIEDSESSKFHINIDEAFAKSIPYIQDDDATIEVMEVRGVARHLDKNSSHKIIYNGNEYSDDLTIPSRYLEPIESLLLGDGTLWLYDGDIEKNKRSGLTVNDNNNRKCFTFFSALDQTFRNTRIDLEEIVFSLRFKMKWFPSRFFQKFYVSIHSPNSLPDMKIGKSFVQLETDGEYSITYSQIKVDRLKPGYDTNCLDYDIDYKYGNFNMKSDCVASCYQDRIRQLCKLNGYWVISLGLLRRDRVQNEGITKLKQCFEQNTESYKIMTQCSHQCKNDCQFKHYFFDYKKIRTEEEVKYRFNNIVPEVRIRHNGMPDLTIRHLPETAFITFISNFGGLLGMCLGLSIITVFNDMTMVINRYKLKSGLNKVGVMY